MARISKVNKSNYEVLENDKTFISITKGSFKSKYDNLVVGDIVSISIEGDKTFINNVADRKNYFLRPNVANIDSIFIVSSLVQPKLNVSLLDNMIMLFQFNNITPILVFTKIDLLKDIEVLKYVEEYKQHGYTTFVLSKDIDQKTIDEIQKTLNNKFVAFTGQSGVGKSTLLNTLFPDLKLKTGDISKNSQRGKHTTTSLDLKCVGKESYIIDTPGFSSFSVSEISPDQISWNFLDFEKYAAKCKYKGCLHIEEKDCEIKKLVEDKQLSLEKYENYKKIVITQKTSFKNY